MVKTTNLITHVIKNTDCVAGSQDVMEFIESVRDKFDIQCIECTNSGVITISYINK